MRRSNSNRALHTTTHCHLHHHHPNNHAPPPTHSKWRLWHGYRSAYLQVVRSISNRTGRTVRIRRLEKFRFQSTTHATSTASTTFLTSTNASTALCTTTIRTATTSTLRSATTIAVHTTTNVSTTIRPATLTTAIICTTATLQHSPSTERRRHPASRYCTAELSTTTTELYRITNSAALSREQTASTAAGASIRRQYNARTDNTGRAGVGNFRTSNCHIDQRDVYTGASLSQIAPCCTQTGHKEPSVIDCTMW